MTTTALGITYLTHVQLGNHNAGEGGRQLSNIKEFDGRPYVSGQSVRHSIRDALQSITDEGVNCHPEDACGKLGDCKICDLFGYMNTDLEEVSSKRYSPLRVSPLVAQYDSPITTDMVVQFGVEDSNSIGYREMTENVYHGGMMLDVDHIGQREVEQLNGSDPGEAYERSLDNIVSDDERSERASQLIESIEQMTNFAGQARHMADFMPDLILAVSQDTYNQRLINSLQVNEDGELNTKLLESVLKDFDSNNGSVYFAGTYNEKVISNWDEVLDVVENTDCVQVEDSVSEVFTRLTEQV